MDLKVTPSYELSDLNLLDLHCINTLCKCGGFAYLNKHGDLNAGAEQMSILMLSLFGKVNCIFDC